MLALSDTAERTVGLGETQLDREHAVLSACLAGDWSDYGWLVARYQRLVWAAVDAVVGDPASCEDVVQEVFVRVYEKLHTFRFRSSFSSWLWRLARNHALSQRRRMGRRPQPLSIDAPSGEGQSAAVSQRSGDAGPHTAYEHAARQAGVQALQQRLPGEYREVLNLFYLGDRTYEDIAALTGLPLNTVRTRLRRARLRLAELASEAGWA